jgi:hypothetical protein
MLTKRSRRGKDARESRNQARVMSLVSRKGMGYKAMDEG